MQANSVPCTVCIKRIHKRFSGVRGDLLLVTDGLGVSGVLGQFEKLI